MFSVAAAFFVICGSSIPAIKRSEFLQNLLKESYIKNNFKNLVRNKINLCTDTKISYMRINHLQVSHHGTTSIHIGSANVPIHGGYSENKTKLCGQASIYNDNKLYPKNWDHIISNNYIENMKKEKMSYESASFIYGDKIELTNSPNVELCTGPKVPAYVYYIYDSKYIYSDSYDCLVKDLVDDQYPLTKTYIFLGLLLGVSIIYIYNE